MPLGPSYQLLRGQQVHEYFSPEFSRQLASQSTFNLSKGSPARSGKSSSNSLLHYRLSQAPSPIHNKIQIHFLLHLVTASFRQPRLTLVHYQRVLQFSRCVQISLYCIFIFTLVCAVCLTIYLSSEPHRAGQAFLLLTISRGFLSDVQTSKWPRLTFPHQIRSHLTT